MLDFFKFILKSVLCFFVLGNGGSLGEKKSDLFFFNIAMGGSAVYIVSMGLIGWFVMKPFCSKRGLSTSWTNILMLLPPLIPLIIYFLIMYLIFRTKL